MADPLADHEPPERIREGGTQVVQNRGARERLRIRDELRSRRARLLFMDGRAASPTPDGGSAWADLEGGRVIVFDRSGRVSRIIQSDGGGSAMEPFAAQIDREEVRIFQRDGTRFAVTPEGGLTARPHGIPVPVTGADPVPAAASRSPLYLPLAPVRADAPLVWIAGGPSEPPRGMGRVTVPDEPMLGYLHNAGWAVPAPDGGAYFASALRPELTRMNAAGDVVWKSVWTPPSPALEPRISAVDGIARAEFRILQHALAMGADGRVYVLAAPDDGRRPDLLLVFEPDGSLSRTGTVPAGYAVYLDPRGAVTAVPEERTLTDPATADRPTFASFDLPGLVEKERVRLEEYRGSVVVVNFWASWCPPCRHEIPVLDSLARELGSEGVVVVGLNDDRLPRQGIGFLAELGGVSYPNAAGEGDLRRAYGYRGLPYTVVLDRDHRVVRSFYGFGGSLESLRQVVRDELEKGALR